MVQVFSIRGATTIKCNTIKEITDKSVELMNEIIKNNNIDNDRLEIINYIISTTNDITAFYPARAIRESGISAPVFSTLEPNIENSLPLCIRLLVNVSVNFGEKVTPKHIYLYNAKNLRRDLVD